MGTTLVAALIPGRRCEWISVGDSFLFHYRERESAIRRVNPLHTRGAELDERARRGEIRWVRAWMDYDRDRSRRWPKARWSWSPATW